MWTTESCRQDKAVSGFSRYWILHLVLPDSPRETDKEERADRRFDISGQGACPGIYQYSKIKYAMGPSRLQAAKLHKDKQLKFWTGHRVVI